METQNNATEQTAENQQTETQQAETSEQQQSFPEGSDPRNFQPIYPKGTFIFMQWDGEKHQVRIEGNGKDLLNLIANSANDNEDIADLLEIGAVIAKSYKRK